MKDLLILKWELLILHREFPLDLESRNMRILQQTVENTWQARHNSQNDTTASNLFNFNQGGFNSNNGIMLASQGHRDSRNTVTSHIGDAQQFDLPGERYGIPPFVANTTSGFRQNILTRPNNNDGSLLNLGPVTNAAAGHQSYENNQAGRTYADWNQLRSGIGSSGSILPYYSGEGLHHVNIRMNSTQPGGWQRPFLPYQEPAPQGINSADFNSFGQWQVPPIQGIPPPQPFLLGPNGSNHVLQTSSIGSSVPWVQSSLTNLASLVHSSNAIPPTPFASGQDAQAAIPFGSKFDAQRGPGARNIGGVPIAQAPPAQANKRKSPSGPQEGLAAARVTRSRAQKDKGGGPSVEPGSSKPVGLVILDKGKEIAPSINRNTGLVTDSNKLPKKPIFSAHATDTLNMSELQNALIAFQDQRKLTQQQTDLIRQFQNLLQMRQTQPQLKPVDHIKAEDFFAESPELFRERCQLCKLDLKFNPDGSRNSDSGPSVHAVLPCGHCYHYSCLLDIFGPLQPGEDPTCIQCLEGGANSAN
ncbi:uncharacterized protein LOC120266515 [Dioscorea cayenensis subsp. rotundata]|uniref:Uncharacterized protein LOC120266515 n=1 Tax=Dioscorea cayennensis subsp. rotundata TaxID=55577 RepID=A0AB40BRJ0_DIOCR|nr:uncharacterized protein LOC120266515 [Dioscorea cayenensis subsp. rotundata]